MDSRKVDHSDHGKIMRPNVHCLTASCPRHSRSFFDARRILFLRAVTVYTVICGAVITTGCTTTHMGMTGDGGTPLSTDASSTVAFTITDTTGWSLDLAYSIGPPEEAMAQYVPPSPVNCQSPQFPVGAVDWHGRVMVIQARCDNTIYEIEQRPVACDSDHSCELVLDWLYAVWAGGGGDVPSTSNCVHGICQFLGQAISMDDIFALCLADQPRWRDFATARSTMSGYSDFKVTSKLELRG